MPSLRLFGKHWNIASDDFPIPAALALAFHITVRSPYNACVHPADLAAAMTFSLGAAQC